MSDIIKNIYGTSLDAFYIGLGANQILLKNDSSVLIARNTDDSDYVIIRAKAPIGDHDLVTKYYADALPKPLIIKRQADCSAALPPVTAVRGYVVVTTAGTGAVVGDVLFDDGSNDASDMEILPTIEGRCLAITDALAGGTVSLDTDSIYIWDGDGSVYVKIGDIGSVTGPIRTVRYAITNAADQDSVFSIPANARILDCWVEVVTPYSAGGTISVGYVAALTEIMTTALNDPQTAAIYSVEQDTAWDAADRVVKTTIGGAPAVGAGFVVVKFTSPNI